MPSPHDPPDFSTPHAPRWLNVLLLALGGLIWLSGCARPAAEAGVKLLNSAIQVQSTATALAFDQTMVAMQGTQTGLQATLAAVPTTAAATNVPSVPTIAVTPEPVIPPGTESATLIPIDPPAATQEIQFLPLSIDEQIRAAKILLYENMSGRGQLRYVKEALDKAGYAYVDVGSAKGWLKTHLLSGEDWDLIIVAAEYRLPLDGEFLVYLHEEMEKGTAVILEIWDLDSSAQGKIGPILDACGAEFESDWFEPTQRSVWWMIPDHPIFHSPNEVGDSLRHYRTFWEGDLGDLLRASSRHTEASAAAQFLAGVLPTEKDNHANLITCYDGRVILQTFSSHEYAYNKIVPLWQNYIYHTLMSRFQPGVLSSEPLTGAATLPAANPGSPGAGLAGDTARLYEDAYCGASLVGRVLGAPENTPDLFEHHAAGTFLIVEVELENLTSGPIQIWDADYWIEGADGGAVKRYIPDKAATTYLYNTRSGNWYQDRIEPGKHFRAFVAFDVDPGGGDYTLVIQPGAELGRPVCEIRLQLEE